MVETCCTGDTRVERRPRYVYILYVALKLLPLVYGDNALMIQLGKIKLTLNKSNACSVECITSSGSILGGLTYMRKTVMIAVGDQS